MFNLHAYCTIPHDVEVYDIDLFDVSASEITKIKSSATSCTRRIICDVYTYVRTYSAVPDQLNCISMDGYTGTGRPS